MRGSVDKVVCMPTIPLLALLCAGLLAVACGDDAPSVIKTTSIPKPPAWMTKPPQAPDGLYFSGMKDGASSLDEGKSAATDRARDEASKFVGVEVSSQHTDVQSSDLGAESQTINEAVKTRAQALIRSAEVVDVYWEKNSRIAGATTIDRFDVAVLIKLPRAEVEVERKRQADEAASTAAAMAARFRDGAAMEKQGNALSALVRYRDVTAQLKGIPHDTPTSDARFAQAGALRQAAVDAGNRVQQRARRAVLVGAELPMGSLTAALSKKGFTAQLQQGGAEAGLQAARGQGLPYVIDVKANIQPGGAVFSQVAAMVALDVRALDSVSGAVVASVQRTAKGVGRTLEAAARAGAEEAAANAGADLAAALIAKEAAGP